MPGTYTWERFGYQNSNGNLLDELTALRCISLMSHASVVHRERDFLNFTPESPELKKFILKVNETHDPSDTVNMTDGPFNKKYNWMAITLGTKNGDTNPSVAIIYHLLRHRLQEHKDWKSAGRNYGYWALSFGFGKTALPEPAGIGSAVKTEYTDLVKELVARLEIDLKALQPKATVSYIYDHLDNHGGNAGDHDKRRRATKIGELGYAAEQFLGSVSNTFFDVKKDAAFPRPKYKSLNNSIPGWGRDKGEPGTNPGNEDQNIHVTTLTLKNP